MVVLQEPMEDDKERKVLGETEVDNHVKSFENERRLFCTLFGKVKKLKYHFKSDSQKNLSIKLPVLVPVLGGQNLIAAMAVQGRGARFFIITNQLGSPLNLGHGSGASFFPGLTAETNLLIIFHQSNLTAIHRIPHRANFLQVEHPGHSSPML